MIGTTRQITIAAAVFGLVLGGCAVAPSEPAATTAAVSGETAPDPASTAAKPEGAEADQSKEISAGQVIAGIVLVPVYLGLCILTGGYC